MAPKLGLLRLCYLTAPLFISPRVLKLLPLAPPELSSPTAATSSTHAISEAPLESSMAPKLELLRLCYLTAPLFISPRVLKLLPLAPPELSSPTAATSSTLARSEAPLESSTAPKLGLLRLCYLAAPLFPSPRVLKLLPLAPPELSSPMAATSSTLVRLHHKLM